MGGAATRTMHEPGIAGNQPDSKYGLVVISAPSGAGKSTLCQHLLRDLSGRLALSISSTSRLPRGQEVHGKEYFFLKAEEFKAKIEADEFAEWALVHGNYYGTSKKTISNFWSQKRHVLLDIDVQGAESLRKLYGHKSFLVFISPPNIEELEKRLRSRGTDSEETIQKRMKNAEFELSCLKDFDVEVVNDHLETAYQKLLKSVIEKIDLWENS